MALAQPTDPFTISRLELLCLRAGARPRLGEIGTRLKIPKDQLCRAIQNPGTKTARKVLRKFARYFGEPVESLLEDVTLEVPKLLDVDRAS